MERFLIIDREVLFNCQSFDCLCCFVFLNDAFQWLLLLFKKIKNPYLFIYKNRDFSLQYKTAFYRSESCFQWIMPFVLSNCFHWIEWTKLLSTSFKAVEHYFAGASCNKISLIACFNVSFGSAP
jgi:hypothetical protein